MDILSIFQVQLGEVLANAHSVTLAEKIYLPKAPYALLMTVESVLVLIKLTAWVPI